MIDVYFNYTKDFKCYDLTSDPGNEDDPKFIGWKYQICNEMVMPIAQSWKTDMFLS